MTRLMTLGAVAVAALAISSLAAASRSTTNSPARCGKRLVYTFAHPDDVLLFMMPAVSNNLAAGDCVRLIELTAGDAGTGSAGYWEGREQGLRVALAAIANEPDHWTERSARIPGHPATFWKLVGNPRLTLIFLNLPDGQSEGLGFGRTGYQSLYKLWERKIPSMTTLDTTLQLHAQRPDPDARRPDHRLRSNDRRDTELRRPFHHGLAPRPLRPHRRRALHQGRDTDQSPTGHPDRLPGLFDLGTQPEPHPGAGSPETERLRGLRPARRPGTNRLPDAGRVLYLQFRPLLVARIPTAPDQARLNPRRSDLSALAACSAACGFDGGDDRGLIG